MRYHNVRRPIGNVKEIRESFYSNAAHIQAVHKLSVRPLLSSPVFFRHRDFCQSSSPHRLRLPDNYVRFPTG